jgi:hypothetical protein
LYLFGLPQGDLTSGGRQNYAAPARGALARLQQHPGPEGARPFGRIGDCGDLDVGQPERTLRCALDDSSAEPITHLKRQIGTGTSFDALLAPAEETSIEGARTGQIARVELQMDNRMGALSIHFAPLRPGRRPELIAPMTPIALLV